MFRSFFTTFFRESSAVLCAVTIPPADLRSLNSYYYAVCGRMRSNGTKHNRESPEDGRKKRPKHVGVLYLQTHF
jgi:hypothetical protein